MAGVGRTICATGYEHARVWIRVVARMPVWGARVVVVLRAYAKAWIWDQLADWTAPVRLPLQIWWDRHVNDILMFVGFVGFLSVFISVFVMEFVSTSLFVIVLISSTLLMIFTFWAWQNVVRARQLWWLHHKFGPFADWLANSTMLMIGIFVGYGLSIHGLVFVFSAGLVSGSCAAYIW